tara:strand:+ start:1651 stop:3120 length:1470 start_codon:yes stop_codon:yes gene_type:complete
MATQNHTDVGNLLKSSPDKYISLGELLKYNKPDNRDLLIKTYGDQGITGFLQLTGATRSAGVQDEVQYWEEGRLHRKFEGFFDASAGKIYVKENSATAGDYFDNKGIPCRVNDVLMTRDGIRLVVTGTSADANPATAGTQDQDATVTVKRLDGANMSTDAGTGPASTSATGNQADVPFIVIGNIHAQGTKQPNKFYQTDVTKRTNPFLITKETYHVNGSQATNIGWINIGNGDYRWYVKGEMDTRKRFMDQREMMMLFSEKVSSGNISIPNSPTDTSNSGKITGSEGYFQAVEDRGITTDGFGSTTTFSDIDNIIFELDKQGAPSEYAMYVDNKTSLNIDDMLAAGINAGSGGDSMTAGLPGQFGAFNNDRDMAVQLGFKSFTRGGYTFHKHDWKLLNDPTLLGAFSTKPYRGAMVPMTQVTDAKTGTKAPALEMNFKETNGYSRELEHWVEGGGVLGFKTNDEDVAKFHYRSECNLITRAANQHVVLN